MTSQMDLFEAENTVPAVPPRKPPVEVFPGAGGLCTLEAIGHRFLGSRGPRRCRACRCTETDPCTLSEGDRCILNSATGYCSNPSCLQAMFQVQRGGRHAAMR